MPITSSAANTAAVIARTAAIWRAPPIHNASQRRHLFSLPDLNPFSSSGEPQTYHEGKILPYTRRQLYAVVSDVASYESFVPYCTHSRILHPLALAPTPATPNAQQMEAELTVTFLAFTERYTSRVTCVPCESVKAVASSATPLFRTLETTWRFRPASTTHLSQTASTSGQSRFPSAGANSHLSSEEDKDIGPTLLSLDLSFAFANPVHAAVSGAFFGKVSTLMVKAFEERCLKVYGRGRGIE